jgi:hypothetical protein
MFKELFKLSLSVYEMFVLSIVLCVVWCVHMRITVGVVHLLHKMTICIFAVVSLNDITWLKSCATYTRDCFSCVVFSAGER